MAGSNIDVLAEHIFSVLEVDRAATPLLRHFYHNLDSLKEALSAFAVSIAPALLDSLCSLEPPSIASLLASSLDVNLKTHWIVYQHFFRKIKNVENLKPRAYTGSSIHNEGATRRMTQYERFFSSEDCQETIPSGILQLYREGYEHVGTCVAAAVKIPTDTIHYYYARALFKLMEGTFMAKFWTYHSETHGSVTGCCLWEKKDLEWIGLNNHSPLSEVVSPVIQDVINCIGVQDILEKKKEKKIEQHKQYEENKAYRKAQRIAYRTEEVKAREKAQRKAYRTEEVKARAKAQRKASMTEEAKARAKALRKASRTEEVKAREAARMKASRTEEVKAREKAQRKVYRTEEVKAKEAAQMKAYKARKKAEKDAK